MPCRVGRYRDTYGVVLVVAPCATARRLAYAAAGPVSVAILGGDHDLTDGLKRLGGALEYLRVTVKAYQYAE
jgi:hypothetical protein